MNAPQALDPGTYRRRARVALILAGVFLIYPVLVGVGAIDTAYGTRQPAPSEAVAVATTTQAPVVETTTTVAPPVVEEPPPAPVVAVAPEPAPALAPPPPPAPVFEGPAFSGELARAAAAGVPGASRVMVVASACRGDRGRSSWGYFNNGQARNNFTPDGSVIEQGDVLVPLGAICLNPSQPDAYSSLLHEMGHKWFWENGEWDTSAAMMGGSERAAECFARYFGASVFGQGGCSQENANRLAAAYGW